MYHSSQFDKYGNMEDAFFIHEASANDPSPSLVTYDELTGLQDRKSFIASANNVFEKQAANVALAILDLDKLKFANDTFGHTYGDAYIQKFATALLHLELRDCYVGRLGGDEFAVIFFGIDARCATGIINTLRKVFFECDPSYAESGIGTFSAGVVLSSDPSDCFETMYYKADVALYAAKEKGRNQTALYSEFIMHHFDVEFQKSLIEKAIDSNSLVPDFQPIVDLSTGKVKGYESLARIKFGDGKTLKPCKFLKGLRDGKCARRFSKEMLDISLQNWRHIQDNSKEKLQLSINITYFDIIDFEFFEHVKETLKRLSIDWADLIFEIVETTIMDSKSGKQLEVVKEFQRMGAKIALDDFGNGYATLVHLKDWPIDIIKIDRDMTSEILENERVRNILSSILHLAENLNIEVIIEGVENVETQKAIIKEGGKIGQGYHFGLPKPIETLTKILLSKNNILKSKMLLI